MSIIGSNILAGASGQAGGAAGYQIERSLRFNAPDSAYLSRTPGSAGNRKTWTWAGWVKRSVLTVRQAVFAGHTEAAGNYNTIEFFNDDLAFFYGGLGSGPRTTAVFRDASAWMHVCVALDTTQATASNRVKIYVNGIQQTIATGTYPTQNADLQINAASPHDIGRNGGYDHFSGYLADIHFIDSQALTPSAFGEFDTNGVWQPKAFSGGSYGTNGFHLPFSDNSTAAALGTDTSSNGNTWTVNNLSVTAGAGNDSLVDSPTNGSQTDTGAGGEVVGNYCTWNPLNKGVNTTLANGNLDCTWAAASGGMKGTIGISSGKWYWEITVGANASVGLIKSSVGQANSWPGDSVYGSGGSYGYAPNGQKVTNSSYSAYGTAHTNGDVVGVAYDADNGKLFFSRNGTWQASGDPAAGTNAAFTSITGEFSPGLGYWTSPTTNVNSANFGQRPFAYTAPSGFKALCTTNLPEPTIADGSTVMDVALYTGNGSTQTISGLNFSPDLVWIKGRSGGTDHALYDAVRGVQKDLVSNSTAAETTQTQGLTAFNSDGFSLGTLAKVNTSSATYAGWSWDAGTSTVTNTAGSITSQVRANASAGFSIVTYTGNGTAGATIGHGLGVNPSFVIVKSRSGSGSSYYWTCYHGSLGATKALELNSTTAAFISPGAWNNTEPTSSVFSVASNAVNNGSGSTYVAYCFAPVAGYSSFGSYTGNGSADGPFVYTGFRPRWVMWKNASSAGSWYIHDTSRSASNVTENALFPNIPDAENSTYTDLDILSNGFKQRTAASSSNASGNTYIYAAFAESPFQYARAR
jgi:hypothetical protein